MEHQNKPWWQSKGILGGLVAFIGAAAGLGVEDTAEWTDLAFDAVTAAGALLSVYGRAKAKVKIGSK